MVNTYPALYFNSDWGGLYRVLGEGENPQFWNFDLGWELSGSYATEFDLIQDPMVDKVDF